MARVRVHQHVNPLARYYRNINVDPLEAGKSFSQFDLPLHIDIGCGRGRFLLNCAKRNPDRNCLGLEIREPLVDEANQIATKHSVDNLLYVFCNAPLNLGDLLENTPKELIELYSIQFPDPWFKKKHAKRRMVNKSLVESIKENSSNKTRVFVQTDILELFEEINELFKEVHYKIEILEESIQDFKTEREISVENRGLPVYRALLSVE